MEYLVEFNEREKRVLSPAQQSLKKLLSEFSKTHFLGGGTAVALHLGHRRSIDFDFFCFGPQGSGKELFTRFQKTGLTVDKGSFFPYLSTEEESEIEFLTNGVKVQIIDFSRNPFGININITAQNTVCKSIPTPSLEDLACMKLYAMMYRQKWKDAVDLYFLMETQHFELSKLLQKTKTIFQACYQPEASLETILNDNWDRTEAVEYLLENSPTDDTITKSLIIRAHEYIKYP